MLYTFNPKGVCSTQMQVELDENNVIQNLQVTGGCSGNLQAISILLKGIPAKEVIARLKGIQCKFKKTSCADQLALGLEQFLGNQEET